MASAPRRGLRAHEVDRVVSVFAGVNARHARVWFDIDGNNHAFKDESIDERLKPGRPRVTPLPQRKRGRSGEAPVPRLRGRGSSSTGAVPVGSSVPR